MNWTLPFLKDSPEAAVIATDNILRDAGRDILPRLLQRRQLARREHDCQPRREDVPCRGCVPQGTDKRLRS